MARPSKSYRGARRDAWRQGLKAPWAGGPFFMGLWGRPGARAKRRAQAQAQAQA